MRAREVCFIGVLVDRFPSLLPLLQDHLDDFDVLLPHVLMGDLTRWLINKYTNHGAGRIVIDVLQFMEQRFAVAHEHEQELIAVSFLESLPRVGERGAEMQQLLGPTMQAELRRIG